MDKKIKLIENGKIFGKINMIDILLIIIILLAGAFGYKFLFGHSSVIIPNANYVDTKVQIRLEDVPIGMVDNMNEGDIIYDNETNTYIGKLISFESTPYNIITNNYETNEYSVVPSVTSENIIITVEILLNDIGSDLITANNYNIKVGKVIAIRGPSYASNGYIIKIER